jgi:hypothetical protein
MWSMKPKLRALDKEAVQELFGNGGLALIHAHLISLGNLAGAGGPLEQARQAAQEGLSA